MSRFAVAAVGSALLAIVSGCFRPAQPPVDEPEPVPTISVPQEDQRALVDGNTRFAVDLYKKLAAKDGNLLISPYSISSALASGGFSMKRLTLSAPVASFSPPSI